VWSNVKSTLDRYSVFERRRGEGKDDPGFFRLAERVEPWMMSPYNINRVLFRKPTSGSSAAAASSSTAPTRKRAPKAERTA
jgi:hypothetical protein